MDRTRSASFSMVRRAVSVHTLNPETDMQLPLPLTRDLVLVGGGHSHALLLRMWGMKKLPGARLTLINPGPTAPYSGMLPGHIAGHYTEAQLDIDLVRLSRFAGARFVDGAAAGIDPEARLVHVPGLPDIRFDVLSLDIGVNAQMPDLPGFEAHGVPAKPLYGFARAWENWCARLTQGDISADIVVIGAGLAGVELALAMRHRTDALGRPARIRLIDAGRALSGVSGNSRAILFEALRRNGIPVDENCDVSEITAQHVRLSSGRVLPASFVLGAAGAKPHAWVDMIGLSTRDGFVNVDRFLRSTTNPAIFASGDCAHLSFAPRPKAGVYAVRAAPVLYHNLRATLGGGKLRPFRPQRDFLKLASLGDKRAVADRNGLALAGERIWQWKDRIDRQFMQKLQDLPRMPAQPLPPNRSAGMDEIVGDKPLCGGCGAKVSGSGLKAALEHLPAPTRSDVLSLPGDDAAILETGGALQVLTTDHLRAFTEDPVAFARIAAVHALGDIWAMAAEPQAALANLTLPPMGAPMQAQLLRDILDSAGAVFRAEGADLVGGHTSIGAELSIGFTLTGLAGERPVTLANARPGDTLVLTKPLGTGTVLAGEMQGRARGEDVLATLARMGKPQGDAARILANANAMTDVTGFGLAGHLMAICDASGVGAEITLEEIPFYPGAVTLAAEGIRSTLFPANKEVSERMALRDGPRSDLLFDPQTAGGLLAALPSADAGECLLRLRDAGHDASQIGRIMDSPPQITVL